MGLLARGFVLPFVLTASLAACGSDNGEGFYASGSLDVTFTTPGSTEATTTGMRIPEHTRIDRQLASDRRYDLTGTCSLGPGGRRVELVNNGADVAPALARVTLALPDWEADDCTRCEHGTLDLNVLGRGTFHGAETRGADGSTCTFTTARNGSYGMTVAIRCSGVPTTENNGNRAEVTGNLVFEQCDGPGTRN